MGCLHHSYPLAYEKAYIIFILTTITSIDAFLITQLIPKTLSEYLIKFILKDLSSIT